MNCTTCRYELSLCLDGRLPSGRRTLVLQHAEACAACNTFWAELQAAQALTLRLRKPAVSADFREQLWTRIRSGEGTPEAVFREPVPLWAKLRYAASGAAAAALLLVGWSWWMRPTTAADPAREQEAVAAIDGQHPDGQRPDGGRLTPRASQASVGQANLGQANLGQASSGVDAAPTLQQLYFDDPLLASTQRLTFDLVAVETAKQLDQRYSAATMGLRRLDQAAAPRNEAEALRTVIENVDEFQAFGELLLDLHDRRRLYFTDAQVGADLRVAVDVLGQSRAGERNVQTVRSVIGPALRSNRLAAVSRTISLVPTQSPREELDVLQHLHRGRPEVFRKLFIEVGSDAMEAVRILPGGLMVTWDDCGLFLVAPRSAVEEHAGRPQLRGNGPTRIELRSR